MEPYRGVEPRCFAWKANVFPLDQYGAVGPAGIEPAYAGIRPAAKSVLARDPLSGPAESNRVSPESESGRLPSSSIPRCVAPTSDAARWRWRESNPLRRRLQGVSATSAVIPMAMRRPVQPVPGCSWALFRRIATSGRHGGLPIMVLTLLTCQQTSTFTLGWCSAGPQELNPHSARVGAEPPIRWLIPR